MKLEKNKSKISLTSESIGKEDRKNIIISKLNYK